MNHRVHALILCTALAAPLAHAQDLHVLPATPDAWRITVGHWEAQVELTGEAVAAPAPQAEYARSGYAGVSAHVGQGRRDALAFEWRNLWQSLLRVESRTPLDLRPYAAGTLEFDLDVTELARGGIRVKLACGPGCERSVNLIEPARGWAGQGWQHVSLPMSCFARERTDLSAITMPFALEGTGDGRVSVANVRIARAGKPGLACPDYRTESVTPSMLNEAWAIDWWKPRHEQKLEEKRQLLAAGTLPEIVFIGDSITQGWEKDGRIVWQQHFAKHHALALGFGGDRTENVLWRLQHGEIDGLSPKAVVLMIGTNNTGHRAEAPATTAAGIKRLLDEIHQRLPQSRVLLLAIFPRGERPDDAQRLINEQVNQIIAGYADGRNVHFLNINAALLQPDGTLSKDVMPDLLHPNERGYDIWQRAMAPTLQQLLRAPQ
ncbi:GDSL-type esterase/lipase family protein [Roseateles cellulosilyticus]|uniref:GDSL-type esterase/lipase family protein n=1 Tax=Pelomonas cellulosilytica TaxID=2906762 RepID=A0ABS8Y3R5_9BURK|nr:GDSL-type esterase/lipase family protein [Pelomonas sp. P8]MCE4557819.1 GDSL-type esterase/lipase family protein [Pelomonas sp. P8]